MAPASQFFPMAAAALILVAIEIAWRRGLHGQAYDLSGALASFGVLLGHFAGAALGAAAITPVYLSLWAAAPVKLPLDDWRVWAGGFLAVEFAYYWMHRWSHTVRWLWATHAVHHSANSFTLPAALRLGWTNVISGGWLVFAPLILAGFPPELVVTLLALNLRYQFWLHTEMIGRLGALEWVFNTPSHHRLHHASNEAYLDRNFGGVLIIFDRIFGTFASEKRGETIRYGLTRPVLSNNPFRIAFCEWSRMAADIRTAGSFREFADAIAGRPGKRSRRLFASI